MSQFEIELNNISVQYNDKHKQVKTVLHDVSLGIHKGEFISLLGPSGCGKTTILRIMADLQKPTSGEVTVAGMSAKEARIKHKYGMVFQNPVLYDWRTVKQNIALPLELLKVPKKEREEIVRQQLEIVDLKGHEDKYPHELSGGMQQRVGIARALSINPDILFMDEPFSALDEFTKTRLHGDILRIWEKTNKTIVFVTHNISEAVYLSDRVCILSTNPARLSAIVDVDLQRPRSSSVLKSNEFFSTVTKIRDLFEDEYNENI